MVFSGLAVLLRMVVTATSTGAMSAAPSSLVAWAYAIWSALALRSGCAGSGSLARTQSAHGRASTFSSPPTNARCSQLLPPWPLEMV